jgi:hypothetical protein
VAPTYFERPPATRAPRYLRINSPQTLAGLRDLLAVLGAKAPPIHPLCWGLPRNRSLIWFPISYETMV